MADIPLPLTIDAAAARATFDQFCEIVRRWMDAAGKAITAAGRLMLRAFGLHRWPPGGFRSVPRLLRRTAGPATRAQRIARRRQHRRLVAYTRTARRG